MKNNIFYLAAIISLMMISACSEGFLDRKPLDQEVSTNFYQTEGDAMEALVAVYDVLGYQSSPGSAWAPLGLVADVLSDDSFAGGADSNDGQDEDEINNFSIPSTNQIVHTIWKNCYVGIYRANLLLERIDEMDTDEAFRERLIAECKFLRAYFYFNLVRSFENVPLLTQTIKGPSEYAQDQESPEEVYNQIAKDLVESIAVLPTDIPSDENGRITKWAAEAMLGRVFLFYNGVYGADLVAGAETVNKGKALEYIEDIIANSNHALLDNYDDIFRLASEFSVESVFEISYGDTPPWWDWGYVRGGEGNLAAQMQGPRVTDSDNWDRGWSFATVSQRLVDDMDGDPRVSGTILFEEELDGTLAKGYQHTGYFSKKYSSDAEHWGSDGQFELNRTCNFRVIRFAEVLLMGAELGSPNAQDYLDQVRDRVGLPSIPVTEENIFEERRKELALEGIRYFDVLRRGVDFANQTFTIVGERGPNYVGDQVLFDVTFNPATRGFLPIPQTEIDLSSGLFKQNEGY